MDYLNDSVMAYLKDGKMVCLKDFMMAYLKYCLKVAIMVSLYDLVESYMKDQGMVFL